MMQIPYHDIWSIPLRQVPHMSNSSHLLWNLEDPVLVQTLSNRKKATYPLLIVFSHQLISMRDVEHNMLHLNVAERHPWVISYQWQRCSAERVISVWQWSNKLVKKEKAEKAKWCIQVVWETSIPVWAPKLWRPKKTFQVFFFNSISIKNMLR